MVLYLKDQVANILYSVAKIADQMAKKIIATELSFHQMSLWMLMEP